MARRGPMEDILWVQLLVKLGGVTLLWGVYSLLIRFFPVIVLGCFRAGRLLPGRSLLYGVGLFASSLLLLRYSLRVTGNAGIGEIFLFFQMAGLAAGLVVGLGALNGLLRLMDPEKNPYSTIGLGLALLWMVRMFSAQLSNIICLLIGIYGAGAIIAHLHGDAREIPPAPEQNPAIPEQKPSEPPDK